jgi:hypothetical protein
MRSLIRIVAPLLAVAAIALGGASSTLAASSSPGWSVNEAWCNGTEAFMTCFEVKGHVQLTLSEGTNGIVINVREHAEHFAHGALVAVTDEFAHERFAVNGSGTYTTQVVTHTRVAEGDVTCQYQLVYRMVDYDLVTDHQGGTCD